MTSATQAVPARQSRTNAGYERIMAAGLEVFGSLGFTQATILEITTVAQVSKPLFYRNFSNKQQVFEAVVDRVFTHWHQAVIDKIAQIDSGAEEELRASLLESLEYGRTRPLFKRLLSRDSQLLLAIKSNVLDQSRNAFNKLIEDILLRGIDAGEVRSDINVEHMADLIIEIQFAYANRQLHSGVAVNNKLVESVLSCMLNGILY